MDDLLKRLRDDGWSAESRAMETMREAADEIERLRSARPEEVSQWQRFKGYGMASTVFAGDGLLVDGVKFIYRVEGDHVIAMSVPKPPPQKSEQE